MNIKLENFGPVISSYDLDIMQKDLRIQLPDDYREFLLQNNGGVPVSNVFNYDGGKNFVVRSFFQLDCVKFLIGLDDYVQDVLMIGNSPFGDILCLSVMKKHFGEIFWFSLETDPDEDPHLGLKKLSPTFKAFIERLEP